MPLDVREQIKICKAGQLISSPVAMPCLVKIFRMVSRSRNDVYPVYLDIDLMEPEAMLKPPG